MTRAELIAKLEAAEGPSRELDAEIATAVGSAPAVTFRPCVSSDPGTFGIGAYDLWVAPCYTASIDAALTLVPDGHSWVIGNLPDAMVWRTGNLGAPFRASGATPAIALVIAAIKAGDKE